VSPREAVRDRLAVSGPAGSSPAEDGHMLRGCTYPVRTVYVHAEQDHRPEGLLRTPPARPAVACLVPIDLVYPRAFEVLLAEGLIRPGAGSPWAVEPREAPPGTPSSEALLQEQRADC